MKVLGRRVLVEQLMVKKETKIITSRVGEENPDEFDSSYKVLQLGDDCPKDIIKVGDIPVFGKYVDFSGIKVIERSNNRMVSHVIVPFDDIIGIEDAAQTSSDSN